MLAFAIIIYSYKPAKNCYLSPSDHRLLIVPITLETLLKQNPGKLMEQSSHRRVPRYPRRVHHSPSELVLAGSGSSALSPLAAHRSRQRALHVTRHTAAPRRRGSPLTPAPPRRTPLGAPGARACAAPLTLAARHPAAAQCTGWNVDSVSKGNFTLLYRIS